MVNGMRQHLRSHCLLVPLCCTIMHHSRTSEQFADEKRQPRARYRTCRFVPESPGQHAVQDDALNPARFVLAAFRCSARFVELVRRQPGPAPLIFSGVALADAGMCALDWPGRSPAD
eukprot:4358339-Pleurochrysis_carterae.AAC.6